MKIYELQVVEVPTNMPMIRQDHNDQIYKTKDGKWDAVLREIESATKGQPVLVGTISVEVPSCSPAAFSRRASSTRCSTPSPSTRSARARRSPRPAGPRP